ncbi:MAG: LPP20 family lipoprotein [Sulfurimonas sp.]|nr:LPP20 family lipoprotein [Sulfurimonas sp.]
MSKLLVIGLGVVALVGVGAVVFFNGEKKEQIIQKCRAEGELAPEWVCDAEIEGFYSAVGIGRSRNPSMRNMQAIAEGRSKLARAVQITVSSDKNGTKSSTNISLSGSKKIRQWVSKSNKLYVLVTMPK